MATKSNFKEVLIQIVITFIGVGACYLASLITPLSFTEVLGVSALTVGVVAITWTIELFAKIARLEKLLEDRE